MRKNPKNDNVKTDLRVPVDIKAIIKVVAGKNDRSMDKEAVFLMLQGLRDYKDATKNNLCKNTTQKPFKK